MKRVIGVTATSLLLLLGTAFPAGAMGGSHGHSGFRGHFAGGEHHEFQGHHEFRGRPGMGGRHEFFEHHQFHHHVGTEVFIGAPLWSGPDWWGPPDFYYAEPPVYSQAQPQYYWYYCPNPPGYYPYVQQCPSAWQTVVPPAVPPGQ